MVQILDGKAMALQIKDEIANEVRKLTAAGHRAPHLAAVIVGEDGASQTYVANKERSSKEVGFTSSVYRLPETISEEKLLETIHFMNNDPEIDGFIIQLPLPKHINEQNIITAILVIIAGISSCEMVSNLIHDDEVVARIGKNKLYRSQLEEFIPKSIPAEDSVNLARQYINSWAMEQLYIDVAGTRLSKSEMDVSKELEDYRKSLLKFRYEQRYLSDRLDTCVTHSEIEEYYNGHQDLFILEAPVVKARFMDIMKEAPNVEAIKKKMSSPLQIKLFCSIQQCMSGKVHTI